MAEDSELAAIRAKRLEDLQGQYGVDSFEIVIVHLMISLTRSFVKYRVKMRHKCNSNRMP